MIVMMLLVVLKPSPICPQPGAALALAAAQVKICKDGFHLPDRPMESGRTLGRTHNSRLAKTAVGCELLPCDSISDGAAHGTIPTLSFRPFLFEDEEKREKQNSLCT